MAQAFYNPDIVELIHQILGIRNCESKLSIRAIPKCYHVSISMISHSRNLIAF